MNPVISKQIIDLISLLKFPNQGTFIIFSLDEDPPLMSTWISLYFADYNFNESLNLVLDMTIPFPTDDYESILFFLNLKEKDILELRSNLNLIIKDLKKQEENSLNRYFITTKNGEIYTTEDFKVTLFDYDLSFLQDTSKPIPKEWVKIL